MLQNRPRGVFQQNKNAANIQLTSNNNTTDTDGPLKSAPLEDNRPLQKGTANLWQLKPVSDENFTLPVKKLQPPALNDNAKKSQLNKSPKEPSPPKLKAYTRNSLRHHLQLSQEQAIKQRQQDVEMLIDVSEDAEDNLKPKQPIQEQPTKISVLKEIHLPTDENQHQQTQDSAASRIPRLSLRFSHAPAPTRLNALKPIPPNSNNTTIVNKRAPVALKSLGPIHEIGGSLSSAKDKAEPQIEDIDKSNTRDAIFLVSDVAKDIYDYMFTLERKQSVPEEFLNEQPIFTPKVRQRLINWCITIHSQLSLLPETLYITIGIIDRFFQKFIVNKQHQVQLFASAALLIASKYEEIYPPDIADLLYLTQNNYSKKDILRAEIYILKLLEFELGRPIPLSFLRRFSKAANCNLKMHTVAKYFMELSLTEYECAHWHPSLLAAASLFCSLFLIAANNRDISGTENVTVGLNGSRSVGSKTTFKSTRSSPQNTASMIADRIWTKQIVHYSKYAKDQVLGPASTLCKILKRSQKSPSSFDCVKKNLQELSKWPELKTTKVDDLIKLGDQFN